jgi:hypothetical protein
MAFIIGTIYGVLISFIVGLVVAISKSEIGKD